MSTLESILVSEDWIRPADEPRSYDRITDGREYIANALAWAVKLKGVRLEVAGPVWIESANRSAYVIRLGDGIYPLEGSPERIVSVLGLIAKATQFERDRK
jgi:hypothetical protein